MPESKPFKKLTYKLIFSVRKKDAEDDEPHMRTAEYSMFMDED